MSAELLLAVVSGSMMLVGGAIGWMAQIIIAQIKAPPKQTTDTAWNGTERRTKELIEGQITLHAFTCPAKRDFYAALKELRSELKVDLEKYRDELKADINRLHEEIQREK